MAERGPARRSRATRALVLLERTDRQPLLRGHVGMKMFSAAETVAVVRPVERAKPFPDGVELCMERSPARGCRLYPVQRCADLGRTEPCRDRWSVERVFCGG